MPLIFHPPHSLVGDFCSRCGSKANLEPIERFDMDTGEQCVRPVCPNACAHGWHVPEPPARGFIHFIRNVLTSSAICRRCGKRFPLGDD